MGRLSLMTLAVPAVVVLALAGCGDQGAGEDAVVQPEPEPEPAALVCPAELTDLGAGSAVEPADAAPQWPDVEAAVVCEYALPEAVDGASADTEGWVLDGTEQPVPDAALPALGEELATLEPAAADRFCRLDIGPRLMVVTSYAGGTAAMVLDEFGCGDVLLTADPASVAPGTGGNDVAVSGSLSGPTGLGDRLRALAG